MNYKIKILSLGIIIFFSLFLFSCDNIKTEKDKYPDIPEYPKFKNNTLKLVKVKEIENKIDSTFYQDRGLNTRILVKDSTLYLISFFPSFVIREQSFSYSDLKYTIDLVVIKNNKINHRQWVDNDFKINFEIDKNNNDLTIGKHKYSAKSNYYKEKTITNLKNENDTTFYKYLNDIIYLDDINYKATVFDQATIKSRVKSGAVANSPGSIFIWEYQPVYLTYYKFKYKNKIGLTKVYDKEMPVFIKLNEELYYINREDNFTDKKNKTLKIAIYKIE